MIYLYALWFRRVILNICKGELYHFVIFQFFLETTSQYRFSHPFFYSLTRYVLCYRVDMYETYSVAFS